MKVRRWTGEKVNDINYHRVTDEELAQATYFREEPSGELVELDETLLTAQQRRDLNSMNTFVYEGNTYINIEYRASQWKRR